MILHFFNLNRVKRKPSGGGTHTPSCKVKREEINWLVKVVS